VLADTDSAAGSSNISETETKFNLSIPNASEFKLRIERHHLGVVNDQKVRLEQAFRELPSDGSRVRLTLNQMMEDEVLTNLLSKDYFRLSFK
jgi:hypothetical protein